MRVNNCGCAMKTVTANLMGRVERRTLYGREYLVAPVVMIVPGVLENGHNPPLLYTLDEISRNVDAWNGMPIVVNHPVVDGQNVSARDPTVLESWAIGYVFNVEVNGKLSAAGWFDVERTRKIEPQILADLQSGKPMELSTGLLIDAEENGGVFNGVAYTHVARSIRPDHLAILPDGRGACSLSHGCGVLANGRLLNPDDFLPTPDIIGTLAAERRAELADQHRTLDRIEGESFDEADDSLPVPRTDWVALAMQQR